MKELLEELKKMYLDILTDRIQLFNKLESDYNAHVDEAFRAQEGNRKTGVVRKFIVRNFGVGSTISQIEKVYDVLDVETRLPYLKKLKKGLSTERREIEDSSKEVYEYSAEDIFQFTFDEFVTEVKEFKSEYGILSDEMNRLSIKEKKITLAIEQVREEISKKSYEQDSHFNTICITNLFLKYAGLRTELNQNMLKRVDIAKSANVVLSRIQQTTFDGLCWSIREIDMKSNTETQGEKIKLLNFLLDHIKIQDTIRQELFEKITAIQVSADRETKNMDISDILPLDTHSPFRVNVLNPILYFHNVLLEYNIGVDLLQIGWTSSQIQELKDHLTGLNKIFGDIIQSLVKMEVIPGSILRYFLEENAKFVRLNFNLSFHQTLDTKEYTNPLSKLSENLQDFSYRIQRMLNNQCEIKENMQYIISEYGVNYNNVLDLLDKLPNSSIGELTTSGRELCRSLDFVWTHVSMMLNYDEKVPVVSMMHETYKDISERTKVAISKFKRSKGNSFELEKKLVYVESLKETLAKIYESNIELALKYSSDISMGFDIQFKGITVPPMREPMRQSEKKVNANELPHENPSVEKAISSHQTPESEHNLPGDYLEPGRRVPAIRKEGNDNLIYNGL